MADISKITLPNGNTYDIKDSTAREQIAALVAIDNGVRLIGVTTTALTDNATTATISVNSANHTAIKGDLVFYENKEFLFDGTKWHLLDELSTHGTLATKNKVKYDKATSASYTSTNSTKTVNLTGTSSNVAVTATANTSGNYQPAGTVTQPTFSGSSLTSTGSFTPEGTVTVTTNATSNKTATVSAASSGTATYTPAGTVSQPTFSNGSVSASGSYTPAGTITFTNGNTTTTVSKASSGDATYTPQGTVSAPTISVATAGSTNNTLKPVTAKSMVSALATAAPGATAPANAITYYAVSDETLSLYQIGATKADSVTLGSAVTVKTSDATYTASAPTFTGTGARLVTGNISRPTSATFSGTEGTVEVTGTATGTVSTPTFTGTGARLVTGNIPVPNTYTATFAGTAGGVSVTGTPAGTVSQPTFTGTKVQLAGTTTATGSITLPTISLSHTSTEATYE